jgi:hypothetical protein
MQDVIKYSQKKTEKLKAVVSSHQELAAIENACPKRRQRTFIFRESSTS